MRETASVAEDRPAKQHINLWISTDNRADPFQLSRRLDMFDQLFNCPETVALHQSAPLLDARVRYLQHCEDVGSPRGTLRRKAHELLVIVDQMNLQPEGMIDAVDIEEAARRWAYRQPSHYKLKDAEKIRRHFIRTAKRWFGFLGLL